MASTAPHWECPITTTSLVPNRRGRKLHAPDLRRRHDIARDPDDEQIAEPLIEDQLRGDARVGAAKDDGKRFLSGHELGTSRRIRQHTFVGLIRGEALIAFPKPLEGLMRIQHGYGNSLSLSIGVGERRHGCAVTWRGRVCVARVVARSGSYNEVAALQEGEA